MISVPNRDQTMGVSRADALCEHYQKTFELVLRLWERRNRLFVIVASVVATAATLSIFRSAIQAALIIYLRGELVTDQTRQDELNLEYSVPLAYELTLTFMVIAVFYLIANLYHRSVHITNYWAYLGALELEIRRELKIRRDDMAFSREGRFFKDTGNAMSRWIGLAYKWILGLLLLVFFYAILQSSAVDWASLRDFSFGSVFSGPEGLPLGALLYVFNILVCILTLLMFVGYARGSAAGARRLSDLERRLSDAR